MITRLTVKKRGYFNTQQSISIKQLRMLLLLDTYVAKPNKAKTREYGWIRTRCLFEKQKRWVPIARPFKVHYTTPGSLHTKLSGRTFSVGTPVPTSSWIG